eukprot:COSAG05_NODE_4861_length_1345_cov_0.891653_1_plen_29_part_10
MKPHHGLYGFIKLLEKVCESAAVLQQPRY